MLDVQLVGLPRGRSDQPGGDGVSLSARRREGDVVGYAYDPAGNRTAEQIDDTATLASHDKLDRLTTQVPGGPMIFAGTVNEPATVTIQGTPATVSATNQFRGTASMTSGTNTVTVVATDPAGNSTTRQWTVDVAGQAKTFTFDANGNLSSDGTRTLEWDARNRLVAVTVGTHRSEFTYDGDQRRVRTIEKENSVVLGDVKLLWCQTMICEERAADGVTVTRRSFSQGEQITGTSRYFAADHLGSVTDVTDGSVTPLARYAFDPWGGRIVTAGTDITNVGYTGHRWQSSGSGWLAQYRFLDSTIGRWASEDPLGLQDGPNLYAYVTNNPLSSRDPDGRAAAAALPGIIIGGSIAGPPGAVVGGVVAVLGGIIAGICLAKIIPFPDPAKRKPKVRCFYTGMEVNVITGELECMYRCADGGVLSYGHSILGCPPIVEI